MQSGETKKKKKKKKKKKNINYDCYGAILDWVV